MSNRNKYLLLTIAIIINISNLNSQINEVLNELCESISKSQIKLDNVGKTYNTKYEMSILNGTLNIRCTNSDSITNNDNWEILDGESHTLHIKDIENIHIVSTSHASYYPPLKQLEIKALRNYQLFKTEDVISGKTRRTELIEIPIYNISDTTYFSEIIKLISEYAQIKDNSIRPLCKYDNLQFEYGSSVNIYAIENESLSKKIELNGSDLLEFEIHKLLCEFLIKENILKFYATIVLNENDKIIFCSSYQNEMYNHFQSLDNLTISQKVIKKNAHIEISDEIFDSILSILKKGNWSTGICHGQKVNSYFDFFVENEDYREE